MDAMSLGTPWIGVEQFGLNDIFFWNPADVPGNHCSYLLFNGYQNSCNQFVFLTLYRWIYTDIHLHMVCLDCQQAVVECNSKCAWRSWSLVLADQFLEALHQQNVNRSGLHVQTPQTHRSPLPVLLSAARCSPTPLELYNVLSDSAKHFQLLRKAPAVMEVYPRCYKIDY